MSTTGLGEDRNDDIGRLFAKLTAELEYAHELSVEGQNPRLTMARRRRPVGRIRSRLVRCETSLSVLAELLEN